MPRKNPFRKISIDENIAQAIERRMAALQRREALTPFIEWVLGLYCSGFLVESEEYRRQVYDQIEKESVSKKVHKIGPAKGVIEHDEGKSRKAS